jgi:hypothetical protein
MRAIAIEPAERSIAVTEVHFEVHVIAERFASPPRAVARFPNGDVLLAAPTEATEAFTVGGSKPIVGPALLVGRRNEFSEHAAARTSLDVVRSMVRWTSVERKIEPARPSKVRVVVIDPGSRSIEETEMQATVPALETLLRAPPLLYFRVAGGNLYGDRFATSKALLWRKDDFVFPGRVVIVGVAEDDSHMLDATNALSNLRETVKFRNADTDEWVHYNASSTSI